MAAPLPGCPQGDPLYCARWEQLENQLGRPQPSPADTRAAPLASWSALSRATMMRGEERENNHLYRHNILLQKSA